ncbi:MAG TPA: cation:proton antiporter [Rubrivivax sp.]|nr:cation:proton antiporter [Rubrivivax sp.]
MTDGTPGILPQAFAFDWLPDLNQIDPVLGLAAVMLIAVVAASALHRLLRLPRLAGYMLVGVLASPTGLGLLRPVDLDGWKPIIDLAIAALVFELGSRLRPRWLLDNPWFAASCVLEGLCAALAVGGVLVALGAPLPSAMLAAMVAASTSPVIAMASVHELRPRGQVGERLLMMCAINSVLAMLALKLWPLLAMDGSAPLASDALGWIAGALLVVCGSFLLGLFCGWILDRAAYFSHQRSSAPVLQIALVMLASTLASNWGLSPLLTLLVAGMTARSLMGHRLSIEPYLGSAGAALMVLLFISLGVLFTVEGVRQVWPWVLVLIAARLVGKGIGVAALARPSGLGWRQALGLTLALQPMSSLAVLLVADNFRWGEQLRGYDPGVMQALLLAAAAMQLTGPLWLKLALQHVAEECREESSDAA